MGGAGTVGNDRPAQSSPCRLDDTERLVQELSLAGLMDKPITPLPVTSSRPEQIFPTLTPAQIRRTAAHGQRRKVRKGEILVEQGDKAIPFFVVLTGELEAVRPGSGSETLITIFRAEQFTGEVNTLS